MFIFLIPPSKCMIKLKNLICILKNNLLMIDYHCIITPLCKFLKNGTEIIMDFCNILS